LRHCGALLAVVFAVAMVPAKGEAIDDKRAWLVEVSQAQRHSNFQGVLLYRSGDTIDSFRVTHRYKGGEARERLQTLTGEQRDVVRRGNKVICLVPPGNRLPASALHGVPQSMIPKLDDEQLRRIEQSYKFAALGEQRIAGRRCEGLSIKPRDPLRYGYEVWADKETKVPLKILLTGSDGKAVEQIMFTEVRFPESIADEVFDITPQLDQGYQSIAQEQVGSSLDAAAASVGSVGDAQMGLVSIPDGFEVVMFAQRDLPNNSGTLRHWIISDGLTFVSIFGRQSVGERRSASMPQSATAVGAMHAYRQIVGSVEITVVGEVPSQTVQVIAEGTSQRLSKDAYASARTSP
jgi:sigma-E factor negative regulatory protein RseB